MNQIIYKKASLDDIECLTEVRIKVLRSANRLDDSVDMSLVEQQTREYYGQALKDGSHAAYLALDDGRIVGTGGVSFFRVAPIYRNPTGYKAYIMNMYTEPDCRRQGIAYHMLDCLVAESRERGVNFITLEATEMGEPLYEKYGFVKLEHEMKLIR